MSRHGCFDHPPYKDAVTVQDGWNDVAISGQPQDGIVLTQVPRMVVIDDAFTHDRGYCFDHPHDPKCAGCVWHKGEKE